MIIFNLWALLFFFLGAMVQGAAGAPSGAMFVVMFVADAAFRFYQPAGGFDEEDSEWLSRAISPVRGGHVFFLPVWGWAIALLAIGAR